ncbi:MAG TPA: alpha/beta hydrolase [Candidatus Saccharibacteria bacterium]|nr:alpha/beta hydrolase [Candidatus Saccharibacteria bacterium]HRN97550.1 alpha/beta hydrolase [Candidatus Saccharibacteria bacterium]HRQ06793.1 alpha/beta hydrolase [Candidatus Saccharibacteria bacterium]
MNSKRTSNQTETNLDSPIVMLHGLRGTRQGLFLIKKHLAGFKVIIPDLPAFGTEAPYKSQTIEDYVEWINDFISKQDLTTKPLLIGHSFGSIIAAGYAAKYPSNIQKLILINPVAEKTINVTGFMGAMFIKTQYWLGRTLPEKAARKLLSAKIFVDGMSVYTTITRDQTLRKFIRDQHRTYFSTFHDTRSLSQAFMTSASRSVGEFATKIKTPTLLIAGDKDYLTKVSKQQELANKIKNSKLVVIKNVGHLTHYETPDQIADEIKKFI